MSEVELDYGSPPCTLGELLAIMHGDGGHYQARYGTRKAIRDAAEKFHGLCQQLDRAELERDEARLEVQRLTLLLEIQDEERNGYPADFLKGQGHSESESERAA